MVQGGVAAVTLRGKAARGGGTAVRDEEQKKALGHLHVSCLFPGQGERVGGGKCPYARVVLLLFYRKLAAAFVVSTKKHAYDNNGIMYCVASNNVQNVDSRRLFCCLFLLHKLP